MEKETLATELIHELKAQSKRWFIAFLVVLALWFGTIGAFIWYISLPVEEYGVNVLNDEGNANYIGRDLNGEVWNGTSDSDL